MSNANEVMNLCYSYFGLFWFNKKAGMSGVARLTSSE